MKRMILLSVLLALAAVTALADIARPDRTPNGTRKPKLGTEATLRIKIDRNATEAKLIIPKSKLKQLRAELDQADDDNAQASTESLGSGTQRLQTIMGGFFLSLSVVFGGFWVARKKGGKGGQAAALIAVAGASAAAVSVVYANVGPPPAARSITSKLFDQKIIRPYNFAEGKIMIETGDGETYQLIVPDAGDGPESERPND